MNLKFWNKESNETEIGYKMSSVSLGSTSHAGPSFYVRAQSPKKAYELYQKIKKQLEKEQRNDE